MIMIKTITINDKDIVSRIGCKKNVFEFKNGINLLIGENGSGKSTLLNLISSGREGVEKGRFSITTHDEYGEFSLRFIDMSKQGKNKVIHGNESDDEYMYGLISQFKSSGQAKIPVLLALEKFRNNTLVLIDEPELSLDFEHMIEFINLIEQESNRLNFVISTHNPLLIKSSRAHCVIMSKKHDYKERLLSVYSK